MYLYLINGLFLQCLHLCGKSNTIDSGDTVTQEVHGITYEDFSPDLFLPQTPRILHHHFLTVRIIALAAHYY